MTFAPLSGLHSLPPELVSHILTLAAPISDPTDPVEKRRRWRTLSSISLVCSEWRIVAQKLLLGDGNVRMYHSKELEPLLKLVVGVEEQGISKILRSLDFTLWGEDEEDLPKLLLLCEGLKELVLEHVDRVRFDQVVTPSLRSFSARQCTFISSAPFNPSPYPTLAVYPHLRNLDLRFNLFRRDSLPIHSLSFPALQNLLLFTGSQDQSTKTVRTFLQAVSPQLKSLSLDHESWELLFSSDNASSPSVLSITTLGLYWDAAALSLVGSSLLVPPPSTSSERFSPPPYLHVSLYPFAIPSLLGSFSSLFDVNSSTAWNWRKIEHLRFEQTFRQLQLDEGLPSSDEEEEIDAIEGGAADVTEKVDPNERLLRKFLELPKKVGLECSVDPSEERGTKERGFKTSWWRFVRDVELGNVNDFEQSIPGFDQPFEIGLYIPDPPQGMSNEEGFARIKQAVIAIRNSDPMPDLQVGPLSDETPFAHPQGVRLPYSEDSNGIRQDVWISIPHPSVLLMHLLEQIDMEQKAIDQEIKSHFNTDANITRRVATIHTRLATQNGGGYQAHANRRNVQVRLVRVFVELLTAAGQSDPTSTDAISPDRLRNVQGFRELKEIIETSGDDSRLLGRNQATEEVDWETKVDGVRRSEEEDSNYVSKLEDRNWAAFNQVRLWLNSSSTPQDEPKSCFQGCPGDHEILS
ncbi:hypothetical protein JCM5350_004439 [Sporobolomyces pararoseus]